MPTPDGIMDKAASRLGSLVCMSITGCSVFRYQILFRDFPAEE
jgi:hypothetical protein